MADPAWSLGSADFARYFPRKLGLRRAGRATATPGLFLRLTPRDARFVERAARARAALDRLPTAPSTPPSHSSPQLARPALPRRDGLPPLRLAAHVLTVGLVLLVALFRPLGHQHAEATSAPGQRAVRPVGREQRVAFRLDSAASIGDGVEARAPGVAPQPGPFRESHILQEGETLAQLAQRYGVSVESLFWINNLDQSDLLVAGKEFRIPRVSGLTHTVAEGETLAAIAAAAGVAPEVLALVPSNHLQDGTPLAAGRELFIPAAKRAYPPEILARYGGAEGIATMRAGMSGMVRESSTSLRAGPARGYPRSAVLDAGQVLRPLARHEDWLRVSAGADGEGWVRADLIDISPGVVARLPETNDFPPLPPRWVWPARGALTSPFGWRYAPFRSFHDGLDIANAAGTKIFAARSGTVYEAGWCSGFGYCVKIDHGDGVTSIYGHLLKRPVVKAGEAVEAGDLVGLMGSTFDRSGGGYSTGVHLHFTIKVNGKAVDPRRYLP